MKIPKHLINTVADYASGLADYMGSLAMTHRALLDDEDPAVEKTLKKLSYEDRYQAVWIVGWFRGVADANNCKPIDVYDAASKIKVAA